MNTTHNKLIKLFITALLLSGISISSTAQTKFKTKADYIAENIAEAVGLNINETIAKTITDNKAENIAEARAERIALKIAEYVAENIDEIFTEATAESKKPSVVETKAGTPSIVKPEEISTPKTETTSIEEIETPANEPEVTKEAKIEVKKEIEAEVLPNMNVDTLADAEIDTTLANKLDTIAVSKEAEEMPNTIVHKFNTKKADTIAVVKEEIIEKKVELYNCALTIMHVKVNDTITFPFDGIVPTLSFNEDGTYNLFSGCNNSLGKLFKKKQKMSFIRGISTNKKCRHQAIEKLVKSTLGRVNNYLIEDNKLILKQDEDILLIFDITEGFRFAK